MRYVCILESVEIGDHINVGHSDDLRGRLRKHNAGEMTQKCKVVLAAEAHEHGRIGSVR